MTQQPNNPASLALTILETIGRWFAPEADPRRIAAISGQWLVDIIRLRDDEPPSSQSTPELPG